MLINARLAARRPGTNTASGSVPLGRPRQKAQHQHDSRTADAASFLGSVMARYGGPFKFVAGPPGGSNQNFSCYYATNAWYGAGPPGGNPVEQPPSGPVFQAFVLVNKSINLFISGF